MLKPEVQYDFFLQHNDIIFVPVAERLVKIDGAVKRPFWYELVEGENLIQLIDFAGGLQDNAYKENIQVRRISGDREMLIDVNLQELMDTDSDFVLQSGDSISVREIPKVLDNYVKIAGAVDLPGEYEIKPGMRIYELLQKGQLQKESRTDMAFLLRTNPDQTFRLFKLNLDEIMNDPASSGNIQLVPKDSLTIYSLESFTDKSVFSVTGAVRNPIEHPWDPDENIRVQDAILLSGGLLPNATDFAYIIRTDISNPNNTQYLRINLQNAFFDPQSEDNAALRPFDQLNVPSTTDFSDISTVQISGAVRTPGEYQFDQSLNLRDLLTLAGGLKLEAAPNRIDIFRIEINKNEPTRTIVASVEVNDNLQLLSNEAFPLQAYDQIVVRTVPEFEFQQIVTIEGEVKYPGDYALIDDNERLLNLINRAGGMTREAFAEGVTILRSENNTGYLVTHMEEVLRNPTSKYNYILKAGDAILIPKSQDLVTMRLSGTKASEMYPDRMLRGGKISVALSPGKNAKWYINNYAVGKTKRARNRLISVEHPNGQLERTKSFLFFKSYPKPKKGSIVQIGVKPTREKREKEGGEPVDWENMITKTLAQATAVLTLVILIKTATSN